MVLASPKPCGQGSAPTPRRYRAAPNARPPRVIAETRTMQHYHSTMKAFSRGQGHSATAAAAYRAGLKLADDRTGLTHDYSKRKGVASVDMLAPGGAPDWCRDPATFWNANEQAETRANARVAREMEISLPAELTEEQRHALAVNLGQLMVERFQVAALVAVHTPSKGGDERNHHVHILLSARQVGLDGLGKRAMAEFDARQGAGKDALRDLRQAVAGVINTHQAKAGLTDRVDPRTLAEQANAAEQRGDLAQVAVLAREPTRHEGKTNTAAKRAGHVLDRARFNDEVRQGNDRAMRDYLTQAEAEGRLHRPTLGQQAQAIADATKTPRQAPTGPLVERAVEGYTTTRNGKTVQIGGYTRQQHSAAPKARPAAGHGPILPRGVSPAPSATAARSGAGLDRGATLAAGATKEQRAEARRQAEELRLAERQMSHEQRLLQDYLDALASTGRRVQQQTEQALRMLVDDRQPITAQAVRFRDWLGERAFIAGALDDARAEPDKRQDALTKATASLERRRLRLDDHKAEPQEAEPSRIRWQSRRAWAERRRERTDWQQQLERKVRHAARRETAAQEGLTPEAWEEMDRRIDAASVNLARHDASRARLFPDAELPSPAPTAPVPPTSAPTEPRPDDPAEKRRQQARINLTPRPELRPRR